MRVVFMGTPTFAVPSLHALNATHDVVGVYTQPDRPSGRGRAVVPSAVKQAAAKLGLPVLQPHTLRDSAHVSVLRELAPDVICVAAYGLILPPDVLAIPPYGCINVHASLLPRHRGAAPVHRAILSSDEVTGVSIMLMEEGLDTGPVARTISLPVDDLDVTELTSRIAEAGAVALVEVLAQVESGTAEWVEQNDALATYAAKITRADVALCPSHSVDEALRRIRAATSSAPSRLCIAGRPVTVLSAFPAAYQQRPGHVAATKHALMLGMADGSISLNAIRPEGRNCMDGVSFARGASLGENPTWEECP